MSNEQKLAAIEEILGISSPKTDDQFYTDVYDEAMNAIKSCLYGYPHNAHDVDNIVSAIKPIIHLIIQRVVNHQLLKIISDHNIQLSKEDVDKC